MSKVEEIKKQLAKPAVVFSTGGFRPANTMTESWIGRVYLYKADEEIPQDDKGDLMLPLFQLCLDDLPFVPAELKDTKALTVFASADLPMDLTPNGENWLIREYKAADELIMKDLTNPDSFVKPFPLKVEAVVEDYPAWDGGGIPSEITDEIIVLENSGEITGYYNDIAKTAYGHKLGGYPSFCQPGVYFGDGFEFVLQIDSDEKANLNIVDSGAIFLAKNVQTDEWKLYSDFY